MKKYKTGKRIEAWGRILVKIKGKTVLGKIIKNQN